MLQSLITRKVEFDAGHRIPSHKSKCRNPHGHRYIVEATVSGPIVDEEGQSDEGMVIDSGDLKGILLDSFAESWDHSFLVFQDDPFRLKLEECAELFDVRKIIVLPFVPTVEMLVRQAFILTHSKLLSLQPDVEPHMRFTISQMRMYETPNVWADVDASLIWPDDYPGALIQLSR